MKHLQIIAAFMCLSATRVHPAEACTCSFSPTLELLPLPADESGVFSGSLFRVVVSKEGLEDRGWVPADLTRLLVVRAGGSAVAGEKWLREIQDGWLVTLAPAEPLAPLTQHSVEFAQIPLTDFVTRKARGMGWARA